MVVLQDLLVLKSILTRIIANTNCLVNLVDSLGHVAHLLCEAIVKQALELPFIRIFIFPPLNALFPERGNSLASLRKVIIPVVFSILHSKTIMGNVLVQRPNTMTILDLHTVLSPVATEHILQHGHFGFTQLPVGFRKLVLLVLLLP